MRVEQTLSHHSLADLQKREEKMWPGLLMTGMFTIVLGLAAVVLPFIAALTIQAILAAVLILTGIAHIIHAFQHRRDKGLLWRLLTGGLYTLIGILLVSFPLQGVLTLTLLLAALFMFSGAFKIALAVHLKPARSWGWLLFNGILSLLLGFIIWIGLPGTARWAIGLIVGIELVFTGWAMVMFSLSIRRPNGHLGENE